MKTVLNNLFSMIRTVADFCTANTASTSGITAFAGVLTTVKNKIILIDSLDAIVKSTTKGVTLDTNQLRAAMTSMALRASNAIIAFASPVHNNTLIAQVNYSPTELKHMAKDEVDDVCDAIHTAMHTNILSLAAYGITPADDTDLATAISLYRLSMSDPRQVIISKKDAGVQIKTLIKETTSELFKQQMDRMVNTLIGSDDNFVSQYYSAREVLNLGHTFTKFRGTAKDVDGNALQGATAKLTSLTDATLIYTSVSNNLGFFTNVVVKPGDYIVQYDCPGKVSQVVNPLHFSPGSETIHHIVFVAA